MDCCLDEKVADLSVNVAEALASDPQNAPAPRDDPRKPCAICRGVSRPVTRKTILLMLKPELFNRVEESNYRFCPEPECHVVYFSEDDAVTFRTEDLRVRVGLKERVDPIPLCYCFGFDEKDAREEIAKSGTSSIPQRIAALIKQKMCACPARNPSGACCLGEVTRVIKRVIADTTLTASNP